MLYVVTKYHLARILVEMSSMFVRLISHQLAVLFSQSKPAPSNQSALLFSQNKSAPRMSHERNRRGSCLEQTKHDVLKEGGGESA
jgi:tagatose-1,6-bisphosphate aldolase